MKKFVKLSLVAAVAVAGLTTANAKPLEEAIKDVDVSGTVVYRYNDYNSDKDGNTQADKNSDTTNYYKIGLNLSSKVNDDVKLNTRFVVGGTDGGFVGLDTQDGADANVNVTLSEVNFAYTGLANTTVKVGKQGLTTPWTMAIDADGNEQTGTGILALTTVGPVTLAGAYFNQTNLGRSGGILKDTATKTTVTGTGTNTYTHTTTDAKISAADVFTIGAMGNVGPVALDAWYLDMADTLDTYTIGAKAGFDVSGVNLGVDLRYTSLDLDNVTTDNNAIELQLKAKTGIVNASYVYVKTDKEGGITALDRDADTSFITWNIWSNGKKDADLHNLSVGVQALDTLHVSANWTNVEYNGNGAIGATADEEQEEFYAQLTYKMSKNLSTYVRYGTYEEKTDGATTGEDDYRGRLQVQYSF
jgi:hypothetical protein